MGRSESTAHAAGTLAAAQAGVDAAAQAGDPGELQRSNPVTCEATRHGTWAKQN